MTVQGEQGKKFLWQRALFPFAISACAFICFAVIYWMCTKEIDPIYLVLGLFLIIPALIFLCIAFFAGKNKIRESTAILLSIILVPVFSLGSLFYTFLLGISATSATITDASRYERTMRLGGYSTKEQLAAFPKKIPKGATDTAFYYSESSWLEYDQTIVLSFSASWEIIDEYAKKFEQIAIEFNSANDITENVFDRVGGNYIKNLSEDYMIYVLMNEGSPNRKVSAVSISQEKKHIIFYAYEMRW